MSYAGKSDLDSDSPGAANKFLPPAAGALPDHSHLLEEESEAEEGEGEGEGDKSSGGASPLNLKKGALTPPRSTTNSSASAGTLGSAGTSASATTSTPTKAVLQAQLHAQLYGQVPDELAVSDARTHTHTNSTTSGSSQMDGADSPPPPAPSPSTKSPLGGTKNDYFFNFAVCF